MKKAAIVVNCSFSMLKSGLDDDDEPVPAYRRPHLELRSQPGDGAVVGLRRGKADVEQPATKSSATMKSIHGEDEKKTEPEQSLCFWSEKPARTVMTADLREALIDQREVGTV
ncbi:hypothetical protein HA466_0313320 [Hirschfeldia incana]|nr:hypothetical protein HA466_0313320 [Hirschfeldia incana]